MRLVKQFYQEKFKQNKQSGVKSLPQSFFPVPRSIMEFDLWYLVFVPVLFFAGWWCRGFDQKQRGESEKVPEITTKGFALLLDGESDKAIDAFIEVVRVDPELTELERVLGNLLRSRGEFERAVRLHRHLYNRADLSDEERALALKELAQDFLAAGFFDRAEAAYRKLSSVPSEHLYALRQLLSTMSFEHEWAAATGKSARTARNTGRRTHSLEIALSTANRIDQALRAKRSEDARLLVEQLMKYADATPRAQMTIAKVAEAAGATTEAVRWWRRVIEKNPDYAPLVIGKLADAMNEQGDRAGALKLLLDTTERLSTADVMEATLSRIAAWQGIGAAETLAQSLLEKHPTLSAYNALLQIRLKGNPDDPMTKLVAGLMEKNGRKWSRFQCRKCGFLASSFSWHCLGCGAWKASRPNALLIVEIAACLLQIGADEAVSLSSLNRKINSKFP